MIVYGVLPVLVFCSVPINQAANANGGRTGLDWPVSSVDAAQVTDVPAQRRQKWNGLTEFKREFTDKGEPPEKTQSTLKIDWYPRGPLSLLRLQLPFPDEHQEDATIFTFFHPRMGDLKTRVGFRSFPGLSQPLATFVELTFPTADPPDLGQQKYQVTPGTRMAIGRSESRGLRVDIQITQTVSVAGDPSAKDINKTNGELTTKKSWRSDTYLYVKLKSVLDWEKSEYTGGAVELKGSLNFTARWSAWLMYGHGVWHEDATGLYESKIGFGFVREIGRVRRPIAAEE